MLPFRVSFGKTMKITPHPKIAKVMKVVAEDEDLYLVYFNWMTLFSKITLSDQNILFATINNDGEIIQKTANYSKPNNLQIDASQSETTGIIIVKNN